MSGVQVLLDSSSCCKAVLASYLPGVVLGSSELLQGEASSLFTNEVLLDSSELLQSGTRCLFTNELLPHSAAFPPLHSFELVVVDLADAAQQGCIGLDETNIVLKVPCLLL